MFLSWKRHTISLLLFCLLLVGFPASQTTQKAVYASTPAADQKEIWDLEDCDISRVDRGAKLVALTFDDAPSPRLDTLLEVFLNFNKSHPRRPAYATLFCNGWGIKGRKKESLFTAFAMGMELGNHSFSHLNLATLPAEKLAREIESVDTLLEEIDGKRTHLFRAPYGNVSELVKATVHAPIVSWFIDTRDWAERSPESLVDKVFERLCDGAIVLMHDGYESTAEGVKALLPALDEAGYQAVSVSQLTKAHGCALRAGCVYTRARKQYKKA